MSLRRSPKKEPNQLLLTISMLRRTNDHFFTEILQMFFLFKNKFKNLEM